MIEEVLFFIGVMLIAVGVIGRAWCLSYIAGNKDETLFKNGPYSICRNPLYLISLICAVGVGFGTETLFVPFIIFFSFIVYYPFKVREEEAALKSKFGIEYENYLEAVKTRIFPSFQNFRDCEKIEITPKTFRKGIFDLFFFIVPLGIFEFIETMHLSGIIPFDCYIF